MKQLQDWFSDKEKTLFQDFQKLLSFPSISSDPKHKKDIQNCAAWLSSYLKKIGFHSEIIPTSVHPLVFAERKSPNKKAPTLLIYNHYDVQPVDPIKEWKSDPFTPTFLQGKITARGASDNKGQLFYTINALRAYLDLHKEFPFHIKYIIEGEEESASIGLFSSLKTLQKKIACDYILVPDFDIPSLDYPAITASMRGIMTMDITVQGSNRDLHSGHHGGIAYNPNRALVEMLSRVFDKKGKITIPGFYEGIQPWTKKELQKIAHNYSLKKELDVLQIKPLYKNYKTEPRWMYPTFEINGLTGGYSGEGFKTVIPASANAKVSCRLVPGQDPKKIFQKVSAFLKKHLPSQMKITIRDMGGGFAVKSPLDSPLIKALQSSYEQVFTKKVGFVCSGGSVPIIGEMVRVTGAKVAFMGLALDSDNVHAPNENFDWNRFKKGFLIIGNTIDSFDRHASSS